MREQETLYQISLEETGHIRHDMVTSYVQDIVNALGYNVKKEYHNFKGPDITGIPIEIKSWREICMSYYDNRYWKRLCDDKIIPKFEGKAGVYVNTFDTPPFFRDYLRSHKILSVYLSISESIKKHVQKLKASIIQYFSFKNSDPDSLHYTIRDTDYSEFNIEINTENYDLSIVRAMIESKEPPLGWVDDVELNEMKLLSYNLP